jgi:myo-inositol-1(or 4)-monophosphatase
VSASPWLPIFAGIAADIRSRLAPLAGTGRGREVVGTGAGGDRTVVLDAVAEEIAIRHLEEAYRSGLRFRLVSEELGTRDFGGQALVLIDPLDGSLNAKQGVPYYSVVLALASGDALGDVELALVHNLATGDEFTAERGGGARRNGQPIASQGGQAPSRYPLVQLEAPDPLLAVERARAVIQQAERLRVLGSVGLNLCHTATGAISLTLAPLPVRAFDLAGPLLVLREAGGHATGVEGEDLDRVPSALSSRTTLLAACAPAVHAQALELLAGR